jgi:hypothetical protein
MHSNPLERIPVITHADPSKTYNPAYTRYAQVPKTIHYSKYAYVRVDVQKINSLPRKEQIRSPDTVDKYHKNSKMHTTKCISEPSPESA